MHFLSIQTFSLCLIIALIGSPLNANTAQEPAIKAAHQLFETLDLPNTYKQTVVQLVNMQISQNPQIEPFREVVLNFFKKHMGWDSIKADIAKLYAKNFSATEINQLNQFYQTPLGKKAARLLPELTAAGAAIGQQKVQDNMAELQKAMAAKAKELQSQPTKPAQ